MLGMADEQKPSIVYMGHEQLKINNGAIAK
jgi:hypothetical protein